MPPVGFESTILESERPKTHALDRTATGIGEIFLYCYKIWMFHVDYKVRLSG
jgi:hypothetical protein